MITIINEIEQDTFLIHLDGTENYQIWEKWELFELLLTAKNNFKAGYDDEVIMELAKRNP